MMLTTTRWFAALAIGALLPATGSAQIVPGAPQPDWDRARHEYTAEVLRSYNDVMGKWRSAWLEGDVAGVMELYAEGAILMVDDSVPREGHAAIERYVRNILPRTRELRTGLSDFVASERLAYSLGPIYIEIAEDTAVQAYSGSAVTILVRDGRRWKIRSQILRHQAL